MLCIQRRGKLSVSQCIAVSNSNIYSSGMLYHLVMCDVSSHHLCIHREIYKKSSSLIDYVEFTVYVTAPLPYTWNAGVFDSCLVSGLLFVPLINAAHGVPLGLPTYT